MVLNFQRSLSKTQRNCVKLFANIFLKHAFFRSSARNLVDKSGNFFMDNQIEQKKLYLKSFGTQIFEFIKLLSVLLTDFIMKMSILMKHCVQFVKDVSLE